MIRATTPDEEPYLHHDLDFIMEHLRALMNEWKLPEGTGARAVKTLLRIMDDETTSADDRIHACEVLVQIEKTKLKCL